MSYRLLLVMVVMLTAFWRPGLLNPEPVLARDANDGLVAVGGVEIMRVRTPSAGMSVRQRADAIQERLVPILSDPQLKAQDIVAQPAKNGDYRIMVKSRLLVTVTKQDAEINKATPRQLAQVWMRHMRNVLPQVNVRPNPNNGEPSAR